MHKDGNSYSVTLNRADNDCEIIVKENLPHLKMIEFTRVDHITYTVAYLNGIKLII
jgi:hypothetical protein